MEKRRKPHSITAVYHKDMGVEWLECDAYSSGIRRVEMVNVTITQTIYQIQFLMKETEYIAMLKVSCINPPLKLFE